MKKLLKKILAVLGIFFFTSILSSCGSNEPEANLQTYDGGTFTLNIDPTWQVMTKSEFYPEIPEEAVVAFTEPEAYNGFYINVNVIEEQLNADITSIDFGRANINLAGKNLTDYEKIQESEIDLNGTPALVHIFNARLNPSEKLLRFIQLYTAKNKTGYTITGAMPLTPTETPEDIRDKVGAIVTSFRLK